MRRGKGRRRGRKKEDVGLGCMKEDRQEEVRYVPGKKKRSSREYKEELTIRSTLRYYIRLGKD